MTHFKPATGYSAMAQVEAYWHALRGNRQMPKRSEIDPRGIEDALEDLVKRIPPPEGDREAPLQALIIDSWFDNYLGVVSLVRVKNGILRKRDKIVAKTIGNTGNTHGLIRVKSPAIYAKIISIKQSCPINHHKSNDRSIEQLHNPVRNVSPLNIALQKSHR